MLAPSFSRLRYPPHPLMPYKAFHSTLLPSGWQPFSSPPLFPLSRCSTSFPPSLPPSSLSSPGLPQDQPGHSRSLAQMLSVRSLWRSVLRLPHVADHVAPLRTGCLRFLRGCSFVRLLLWNTLWHACLSFDSPPLPCMWNLQGKRFWTFSWAARVCGSFMGLRHRTESCGSSYNAPLVTRLSGSVVQLLRVADTRALLLSLFMFALDLDCLLGFLSS